MTAAVTRPLSPAQAVAAATEWWYFGAAYSYLRHNSNVIANNSHADAEGFARAIDVFTALGIDPEDLRGIFTHGMKTPVRTFEDLGACPPDPKHWSRLACLIGKTIHFVHRFGEGYRGSEVAVYYPNGCIETKA